MNAFERFLINFPDWPQQRSRICRLATQPFRYSRIRENRPAGRAGGRPHQRQFRRGRRGHRCRYINKAHSRTALAGLYRASRVGLVTPLRDGMNLVAKEFVAAANPDDPGGWCCRRFAGAARECTAALLVNPYDHEGVAIAINRALSMSAAPNAATPMRELPGTSPEQT